MAQSVPSAAHRAVDKPVFDLVQGEILDEPIPGDCHVENNADYGGVGVSWGLNYKQPSAAACCRACKEHAEQNPSSQPCNVWVWCGEVAVLSPASLSCRTALYALKSLLC